LLGLRREWMSKIPDERFGHPLLPSSAVHLGCSESPECIGQGCVEEEALIQSISCTENVKLRRAECGTIYEPFCKSAFTVLEARSDLRDHHVAVPETGVARTNISERLCPRQIEPAMLPNCLHRDEGHLGVRSHSPHFGSGGVEFGSEADSLHVPMRRNLA
jgi:hypothetical protein